MPIGSEFQLFRGDGVFMRSTYQRGAKISGVMGIGHLDCRSCPELSEERPKSRGDTNQIMRGKRQDGMLSRTLRQSSELSGGMRDPFRRLFWDGDPNLAGIIKDNCITVHDLERSDRSIAFHAANRLLADPLDIGLRIECTAIRATRCGVRIAHIMSFHPSIMARGCRQRGDIDIADPNNNRVSGHSSIHKYRSGYFVAAPNSRGDHRSPASWRCVSQDCSTSC